MSQPRRILVVEDDDDVRQLLTDLLAAEGYEVRGATNGADALALVAGWWPDLVLLEPRLPSDRHALVGRLPTTPTTLRPTAVSVGSLRLESAVALARPFDVDALLAALEAAAPAQ